MQFPSNNSLEKRFSLSKMPLHVRISEKLQLKQEAVELPVKQMENPVTSCEALQLAKGLKRVLCLERYICVS